MTLQSTQRGKTEGTEPSVQLLFLIGTVSNLTDAQGVKLLCNQRLTHFETSGKRVAKDQSAASICFRSSLPCQRIVPSIGLVITPSDKKASIHIQPD